MYKFIKIKQGKRRTYSDGLLYIATHEAVMYDGYIRIRGCMPGARASHTVRCIANDNN